MPLNLLNDFYFMEQHRKTRYFNAENVQERNINMILEAIAPKTFDLRSC